MTIKDLAAKTGYAVGTVSRALNDHPNVSDKAREAILQAADLIIGLLQTLNGDPDADIGKLFAKIHDPVRKETVGRDNDPLRLLVQLPDNVLQIRTDKGLTAGDIGKIHFRQLADGLNGDFLLWLGGGSIAVTHGATRVASVRHDDRTVQFFSAINMIG